MYSAKAPRRSSYSTLRAQRRIQSAPRVQLQRTSRTLVYRTVPTTAERKLRGQGAVRPRGAPLPSRAEPGFFASRVGQSNTTRKNVTTFWAPPRVLFLKIQGIDRHQPGKTRRKLKVVSVLLFTLSLFSFIENVWTQVR